MSKVYLLCAIFISGVTTALAKVYKPTYYGKYCTNGQHLSQRSLLECQDAAIEDNYCGYTYSERISDCIGCYNCDKLTSSQYFNVYLNPHYDPPCTFSPPQAKTYLSGLACQPDGQIAVDASEAKELCCACEECGGITCGTTDTGCQPRQGTSLYPAGHETSYVRSAPAQDGTGAMSRNFGNDPDYVANDRTTYDASNDRSSNNQADSFPASNDGAGVFGGSFSDGNGFSNDGNGFTNDGNGFNSGAAPNLRWTVAGFGIGVVLVVVVFKVNRRRASGYDTVSSVNV